MNSSITSLNNPQKKKLLLQKIVKKLLILELSKKIAHPYKIFINTLFN